MECDEDSQGHVPMFYSNIDPLELQYLPEQAGNIIVDAHAEEKQARLSADRDENESAEVTQDSATGDEEQEEEEGRAPLSYELQEGWKILDYFLRKVDSNLTFHFRDAVDSSYPDTQDYYDKIKEPVWLNLMHEKFRKREYTSITEFVTDFRRMVYNCCSFNGTTHHLSRKADKLLYMLTQKLNLLRHDIRQKTTEDLTTPWLQKQENQDGLFGFGQRKRNSTYRRDVTSEMRRQLRQEEEEKARAMRKLKKEEKCAADLAAQQEMLDWEDKHLTVGPIKSIIRHSWELPQIGMFLHLCRDILNLEEVPYFELERCLAMPRQSSRLQKIMTSLLSTPFQRQRLDKMKMMPYKVWTEKLRKKMDTWYKTLNDCQGNTAQAAFKLGIEERFFEIAGVINPLQEKSFHNLSFYRKVWILKSLCENLVDSENAFARAIEETDIPTDQRETVEGLDRHGNIYIYMPQFCGEFLRIYRHRKYAAPSVNEEEEEGRPSKRSSAKKRLNLDSSSGKRSQCSTPVNESEVESTASPAPSETRARSQASSSRHSSPMPNETSSHSRQTSARNSPAPDSSTQDAFLKKGRRTRNSAESTFFTGDLDELLRIKSRRGRSVKKAIKDELEREMNGNAGDESSQDATAKEDISSAGETTKSTSGHKGLLDLKVEPLEEANSLLGDVDCDAKPDICHVKGERYDSSRSCSPANQQRQRSSKKACDTERAIEDSAHNDKEVKTCDRKVEPGEEHGSSTNTSSSQDKSRTCDSQSPSATINTQSHQSDIPATASNPDAVKTEQTADDSGFLSFLHTSPKTEPGTNPTAASRDRKAKGGESSESGNKADITNAGESMKESELFMAEAAASKEQEVFDVKLEGGVTSVAMKKENSADSEEKPANFSEVPPNSQPSGFCSALVDHDFYTGEEMVPDPEEFELLVEDMEGLEALIKKFAPEGEDQAQQESPVDRPGKRQVKSKTPQKTPKRWACEEELYLNLCSLKNDMERHKAKAKFPRYRQKYHTKLRQEFQEFVEQEPKPQDAEWDTESEDNTEDSTAEDSQSGAEESDESRHPAIQAATVEKGVPSTTSSVDSLDTDNRGIEEYELDVSSRGRLRKRRFIPNSDQPDQGAKRKKLKKDEVGVGTTAGNHIPNILQKSQGSAAPSYLSLVRGIASNEQFVQQQLGPGQTMVLGPHGLQIVRCTPPQRAAATAPGGGSSQAKAFPVMQKILSGQSPVDGRFATQAAVQKQKVNLLQTSVASTLSGQLNKVVTVALASTTSPTVTVSRAAGAIAARGLSVHGGQFVMTAGGKQQVIQLKLQDDLLKKGVLQYQLQGPAAQLSTQTTATTNTPTTTSKPSPPQSAAVRQIYTPQGQAQGQPRQVLITATPRQVTPGQVAGAQGMAGVSSAGQVISPSKMQGILAMPASGHVSPVKLQAGVGVGGKTPIVVNNAGGQKTFVVLSSNPSKMAPKYGNVTVKRLLEDRQANKMEESEGSAGVAVPDSNQAAAVRAVQQAAVVVPCQGITPAVSTLSTAIVPTTLRLPSQSALDNALQTVVTSYHTTLPTADIKVPSPTTLPSLSPRKNVTRTVQSNKSPIFTTSKVQIEKKAVTTIVSGTPTLTLDPSAGPGVSIAKPGTVVLPVHQGLTGVDAASKKQFVVQLISPGVTGNVAQRIVLPQGTMLANLKTTHAGTATADTTALQMLAAQTPSSVMVTSAQSANSSQPAVGGNTQLLGNPAIQGLLMTVPTSSSPSAQQSAAAGLGKVTSEVLKSMLAAKVEGSQHPPMSATLTTPAASSVNTARIITSSAPAPSHLNGAQTQQVHAVIKAADISCTAAASGQAASSLQRSSIEGNVAGLQQQAANSGERNTSGAVPVRVQLQNVAGQQVAAATPRQNIVRVSLPTLQPGVAGIRLLAAGQSVSGAGGQPVLATIKPGTQGVQQLQMLTTGPGLQGMRMQLLSQLQQQQQHSTAGEGKAQATSVVGSTCATQQQQQSVQLCYKVQPNRQVLVNSTVMPQAVLQGTEQKVTVVKPQGTGPAVASQISSPHTPAAAGKIIMASQAAPIANLTTIKLPQSQVNSAVGQFSQASVSLPSQAGGGNRLLSMPLAPSQLNNQFIISPVHSVADSNQMVVRHVNNGQTVVAPTPVSPAQLNHAASSVQVSPQRLNQTTPLVLAATPQKASPKRSLSSTDLQPIPPKMARVDGAVGTSGSVLASLSQMVGSTMQRNATSASGDAMAVSPTRTSPGVQRVVKVGSEGDSTTSSVMQNLAAQIAQGNGMAVATAAANNLSTTSAAAQGAPTQVNMAQILQQIAGVAPTAGPPSMGTLGLQIKPVQQQQGSGVVQQALQQVLYPVRQVGGQLLTTTNLPVTVSNGEVKVLPKATLQMGSQTVTVLSPSRAMIQNLRTPTSLPASAVSCLTTTGEPSLVAPATVNQQAKGLVMNTHSVAGVQGVATTNQANDRMATIILEQTANHSQNDTELPNSTLVMTDRQAAAGTEGAAVTVIGDATVLSGTTSTPLLKARLKQPLISNSAPVYGSQVSADASNGVASSTQDGKQSNMSLSAEMVNGQTGSQNSVTQQNVRSSDTEVEEEAALNLLTFACQR